MLHHTKPTCTQSALNTPFWQFGVGNIVSFLDLDISLDLDILKIPVAF